MLVYLAIVVVFCAIYPIVPRKHIKWLFLALVLALSIMAFYMKPYETDDIGNYFNQVSMLRKGGFSTCEDAFKTVIITGTRFPSADFISI